MEKGMRMAVADPVTTTPATDQLVQTTRRLTFELSVEVSRTHGEPHDLWRGLVSQELPALWQVLNYALRSCHPKSQCVSWRGASTANSL